MDKIRILWADDEIDLLKPHLMFLEEKGYEVQGVQSGDEALDEINNSNFDLIFLDENMPGKTGLDVLPEIKKSRPNIPVVMITKSETEDLMEDAIGSQISDYLIKPVNPNQILLSIKKQLDNRRLVSEKITQSYQQDFQNLSMRVNEKMNFEEWKEVYKSLTYWDLELEKSEDPNMQEILATQKSDANANFSKFIIDHYQDWLHQPEEAPIMSQNLLNHKVLPHLESNKPTVLLVLDNFRYDQWKAIEPKFNELFNVKEDDLYYSILPTATNYARNSMFSGLLPLDIQKRFPDWWLSDEEKGGKNQHEEDFLQDYFSRKQMDIKFSYNKITKHENGKELAENVNNLMNNDLIVVVYNFIDLMSHVRTEMEVLKELAEDEAAYRSLTRSWFEHSPLYDLLKQFSQRDINFVVTTDHGSIRVKHPSKVVGDKNTTTNLRYKQGKSLNYNKKDVYAVKEPKEAFLPKPHVSSAYIFGKEDFYFVYPNNYNYFVNFFKNTFQHGGISLEEMLVPVITMENK